MVCFNCLFCVKKTFSASIVEQRKWKRKRYPFTASSFRFRFHIPALYTGRERHVALIFYILLAMACSEVPAFLQTAGAHYISIIFHFSSQLRNSLVSAARQIANNLSPIAKNSFLGLTHNIIKQNVQQFSLCTLFFMLILCMFFATQTRSFKSKFNLKRS